MFTNPEQFASATKTLFDLQMQTFNALASKAVQGVAVNTELALRQPAGSRIAGIGGADAPPLVLNQESSGAPIRARSW